MCSIVLATNLSGHTLMNLAMPPTNGMPSSVGGCFPGRALLMMRSSVRDASTSSAPKKHSTGNGNAVMEIPTYNGVVLIRLLLIASKCHMRSHETCTQPAEGPGAKAGRQRRRPGLDDNAVFLA